jgi:hypothetical protein
MQNAEPRARCCIRGSMNRNSFVGIHHPAFNGQQAFSKPAGSGTLTAMELISVAACALAVSSPRNTKSGISHGKFNGNGRVLAV